MITVVISSYGYGHLAAHCIESILAQSVKAEQILFVDDGYGDCSNLPKLYPEILFLLRKENLGTVANFQDMLKRVKSEFCLFIGADNWLRSDALEIFDRELKTGDIDVITYDMVLTGELKLNRLQFHSSECQPFQGDFYWSREMLHHGSMLYRTATAIGVGGYQRFDQVNEYSQEDLHLFTKMRDARAKIIHIKEPLLYYRHHRENFNHYAKPRRKLAARAWLRAIIRKVMR